MNIQASDPFLTSLVGTPLQEGAADGSSALDSQQRAAEIGEVIPIVFCRRVGEIGGVLISPPATEARFEDYVSTGNIVAHYHLVLSEGQIDSIQVRDVFQRSCRVGSYTQTYNRRAGTFLPGNFIDNSPNLEAPYYCGTGGTYSGLSTMAFNVTIPAGFDQWNRQVHCFIRGGMWVTRLLDSTLGASNNVVDLLLYLLRNSSRVSDAQIDTTALTNAARFTDANGFWFNGVVADSTNLRDWMNDVLPYFLLRSTRIGGREAVRSLLPTVAATGAIDLGPVEWAFTFTEDHIVPGSFQIQYTSLADHKPFCVLALWRQQPTDDIGIMRSSEVRYAGTALDGPFEQHDLSGFCASEDHAVKVGAYILSRRKHISHTLAITARPDSFNQTLAPGDLVRVRLRREPSAGPGSLHDFLYEVDRIGKSLSGEVQLQLTHFPVDDQFCSVVAQEVASASGNGIVLPTGKTGVTCDINSDDDETIPDDTSLDIDEWDIPAIDENGDPIDINLGDDEALDDAFNTDVSNSGGGGSWGSGGGSTPEGGETDNAEDPLGGQSTFDPTPVPSDNEDAPNYVGQTWTVDDSACPGNVQWYRDGVAISGASSNQYTTTVADIGADVYAMVCGEEGFLPGSVGDDPLPTPAGNPLIRIYWLLGNVYCANPSNAGASVSVKRGGTCTQGKAVYGYLTVNWNDRDKITLLVEEYDPDGCTTRLGCNASPSSSCGTPFTQFGVNYPYGLPDVCDETRHWLRIYINGSQYNSYISSYVGHNVAPSIEKFVYAYPPS